MKKSLIKKLTRMAKDGDPEAIEAVAELVESMVEQDPAAAIAEAVAEAAAPAAVEEAVAEVAADPTVAVETPEGATVVVDESTIDDIITRLDQIIALLTPPAADEDPADPVEEIAEAIEEAVEAAEAVEGLAAPEEAIVPSEEVAEIIEEAIGQAADPVSEILQSEEDECEDPQQVVAGDALRAALRTMQPALAKLPKKQRQRVCADIAARLKKSAARKGKDSSYKAMASARRKTSAEDPKELGRRIMAARNVNHK